MNTNTKTRQWLRAHALTLCLALCGGLIGIIAYERQSPYEAHFLQTTYRPRAASSIPARRLLRKRVQLRLPSTKVAKYSSASSTSESTSRSAQTTSASAARSYVAFSVKQQVTMHSAAPASVAAASSARSTAVATGNFPAFIKTSFPVANVPNWGAMRTPAEWDRTYDEMEAKDFVAIPRYDVAALKTPLFSLVSPLKDENIPLITAKLFYSTHYFGSYNIDADEFTAVHPGLDLKLALGTPIGSIAGGRVHGVRRTSSLGLHVLIEHRLPSGETAYSIYGHLGSTGLEEGQDVIPGQTVGRIGMTGNTTGPHLHLQIDRKQQGETGEHVVYWPEALPSVVEAAQHVYHPITFIAQYRNGVTDTAQR